MPKRLKEQAEAIARTFRTKGVSAKESKRRAIAIANSMRRSGERPITREKRG